MLIKNRLEKQIKYKSGYVGAINSDWQQMRLCLSLPEIITHCLNNCFFVNCRQNYQDK